MVEVGRDQSETFPELFRCPKSAALRKDVAQIFRQPFVHPKQIADHRLLVVGSREPGGPPVFAVPGVGKFMGPQLGEYEGQIGIEQSTLVGDAVIGFVMLEAVAADLLAESVKKVVLAIVACSEKRSGFGDKLPIR